MPKRAGSPYQILPIISTLLGRIWRSEEHTSELQSQSNLVCRLLLEKKNDAPPYTQIWVSTYLFISYRRAPSCAFGLLRPICRNVPTGSNTNKHTNLPATTPPANAHA